MFISILKFSAKMKKLNLIEKRTIYTLLTSVLVLSFIHLNAQTAAPGICFELSFPAPDENIYQAEMKIYGLEEDSLILKMPKWMPGYYQIMDYSKDVISISAESPDGKNVDIVQQNENTWIVPGNNSNLKIQYKIHTKRKFVAQSYVDEEHAYIAPCNTFMYIEGMLKLAVTVSVKLPEEWKDVATGLEPVQGTNKEYTAENFDILYDCPILIGNLEELPGFEVDGIQHRFIGYKVGNFDKAGLMVELQQSVKAATELMGEIPYKHYTFLAIGPGMGGIEHLNNTTISFDGNSLGSPEAIDNTLSFITHEYFHHYNVKRIRPVELGPFDYDRENRTTQLWFSEGLTVYYEYRILKLAKLIDTDELLKFYSNDITASENDPGKEFQSLSESSFRTWDEGPFGIRGGKDTAITYYEKGPVVGLLLDFAIRNASNNQHSLDDVMRYLYKHFYKELGRGFADAEVQQACETFAGSKLDEVFEYITTTKPLDYNKYLGYAGLMLQTEISEKKTRKYNLSFLPDTTSRQKEILASRLNEK